jgi:catechol 2,3-dioxygenase-like lactoylglutathione lyase family enzyme
MSIETKTEANVQQAVPFFRVSNIEKSLRYYVDGLGFQMTNKWIDEGKLRWCWLQLGGAALMLQEFRREGHDSWVPAAKVGEGVSICFQCKDAGSRRFPIPTATKSSSRARQAFRRKRSCQNGKADSSQQEISP